MSQYAKAEIKVIDDQLLLKGVSGSGKLMENITEDSSVVELATVAETLELSFQNIGKIDNLVSASGCDYTLQHQKLPLTCKISPYLCFHFPQTT